MHRRRQTLLLTLALATTGTLFAADATPTPDPNATKAADLIARADRLSDGGDLESALQLYLEATKLDPRASMAFRGSGFALLRLNRPEEAIPYLKDAMKIDPTASRPWSNLGLAYAMIYDRASQELEGLAAKAPGGRGDPEDPLRKRMAGLRSKLAEMDWRTEAIAALREAVRLEPGEAKNWYNLGTTLGQYRPDDPSGQIEALLKALDLDATYYPALRNVALALKRQGRRKEAREVCLRMEKAAGPEDSAVPSILGDLAFADGDLEEAERRYQRLLELEPDNFHGHIKLAILYRGRGDMEKSREHTERAVALHPEDEKAIRWDIERDR